MKNAIPKNRLLIACMLLFIAVGASAWQLADKKAPARNQANTRNEEGDTTKSAKHRSHGDAYRMKELDDAMHELDIQMDQLKIELNNIDNEKIAREVKEALAKVDFSKISEEVTASLEKVDWDKINRQVEQSLRDAREQLKQVRLDEIQTRLQDVQAKLDSESFKINIDSKKINEEIRKGMQEARAGLDKAKEKMQQLRAFTDELEKDGLIDKKKGYRIELNDGELYINGQKQTKAITEKYRKYYDGKKHFTINNEGDSTFSF